MTDRRAALIQGCLSRKKQTPIAVLFSACSPFLQHERNCSHGRLAGTRCSVDSKLLPSGCSAHTLGSNGARQAFFDTSFSDPSLYLVGYLRPDVSFQHNRHSHACHLIHTDLFHLSLQCITRLAISSTRNISWSDRANTYIWKQSS